MARKPITSRSEIQELLNKGFDRAEIMTIIGISNAGITYHLKYTGGEPELSLVERVKKLLPWDITGDQVRAAPYRNAQWHLEFMEAGDEALTPDKRRKLRGFYKKLEEFKMVVRYDPAIPPRPGQRFGGFEYVPREESDGDSILRFDEHTPVAEEDRDRWKLPPREDWPE
ncbi:hypothetical protein [Amycolatopsis sp. NPDC003731]